MYPVKKHLSFLLSALCFLTNAEITPSVSRKTASVRLNEIAALHLKSMPNVILPAKTRKLMGQDIPLYFSIKNLSDYERYFASYQILALGFGTVTAPEEVINQNAIKELELVLGNHTPETNLTNTLNKLGDDALSSFGHVYLNYLICNPTTSIETLKDRQAIIKALIANTNHFERLSAAFTTLRKSEDTLLSCLIQEQALEKMFMDAYYPESNKSWLKWNNPDHGNVAFQEYAVVSGHINTLIAPILIPAIVAWLYYVGISKTFSAGQAFVTKQNTSEFKEAKKLFVDEITHPSKRAIGTFVLSEAFLLWCTKENVQQYCQFLDFLHVKANSIATVIRTARILVDSAESGDVPGLEKLTHLEHAKNLFKRNSPLSADYKKMVSILSTKTFEPTADGKIPTFFSRKGRVKAAFYLFRKIKTEIYPVLLAIAEAEAYLACAKLCKIESTGNHFIFADYLQQETPFIDAQGIWNPFISAEKAIPNDIQLGNTLPLNIILTGPNAGGKSTFLKGLTLDVLLAQTIGIVPASHFSLTPFSKITTYMNISDDTAGGNSLFKSEVLRAQELMETIEKLDKKCFAFSIMDEMFSGTSPREGEAATYAVAEDLGNHTHSILLLATHFPKLKDLEMAEGRFKNYQVRVVYNADGTFHYPFKLTEGAADQIVAIDILKDQGFKGSILDKANKILGK